MSNTATIAEWPNVVRSASLQERLRTAKVLAVGAGGIGCELLKTLVLSGFENIEVIDMDTIETSNLNRQFLFRKRHVGDSKAAVAAKAVQLFRPAAKIVVHHANIKEQKYGVDFFKTFDIVLNGLDNLEARRHVNRLCLASHTPLIESGTAGYLGQVSVHIRIRDANGDVALASECFECQPKAAPKSFPVCTIRNTPDKPIHCIVWAKDLLFQRLFGSPDIVTDLDEKTEEEQNAEADGVQADDPSDFLRKPDETSKDFAERIFTRVFCSDIEKVLSMEELWKSRKRPTPLRLADILTVAPAIENGTANGSAASTHTATSTLGLKDHHKNWTLEENTRVFLKSIQIFLDSRQGDVGSAVFDKDDDLAVEFVTAAANLRSTCYDIPTQNLFDAKGMAGNIIHAIATTNATISGMIVVEAMKVLAGLPQTCKMSYLQQLPSGKRLIIAMPLEGPNPQCVVCGTSQLQLHIHTGATSLATFIDKVLKKRLAMNEPTVMCGNFSYEEGADLEEDEVEANQKLLPLTLEQLPGGGIQHGSIVQISDQAQDFTCQIVVSHKEEWDEEKEPDGFILEGKVAAKAQTAGPTNAEAKESDDEGFEILEDEPQKRKRDAEADLENEQWPKKQQTDRHLLGSDAAPIALE